MEESNKIQQQFDNINLEIIKLINLCPTCKNNIMMPSREATWPPKYKCVICDVPKNTLDTKKIK